VPSESAATGAVHRLGELLGAEVVLPDGTKAGQVNDVRLAGGPGLQDYVVDGFVVRARGEGAFLGYDRRAVLGPWLLRALVRAANREARYLRWPAVRRIDWEAKLVVVERLDPLEDERAPA
jgi:sporulation protein YlmC with PRC-barrel domain